MYDSKLYTDAHSTLESCLGLRQLFEILPPKTELSIVLDNRIFSTLTCTDKNLKLEPHKSSSADIEITFFTESIRRLTDSSPDDISSLAKTFAELVTIGHAKIRFLSPIKDLYNKGYLEALKGLGPELQRDLSKYSFLLLGKMSQAAESLKAILKQ